jgi:hypothetical protein
VRKVLVAVYEVTDPAPVIDIFDKFKAEYNPNGSRNLRDDVAGMTVSHDISLSNRYAPSFFNKSRGLVRLRRSMGLAFVSARQY